MSSNIKEATVVRLKSGGPRMTVSKVKPWNGVMTADCDWFEGGKQTYGSFPVASLTVVDETPSSAPTTQETGWNWS